MASRKTKLNKDFCVEESVRTYTLRRWGLEFLGDVYLEDFKRTFIRELGGNNSGHFNWTLTLKNYIRNNSPVGRFYGYGKHWERRCGEAKQYRPSSGHSGIGVETVEFTSTNAVTGRSQRPNSTWVPSKAGRQALKHIRDYLK